VDGERYREVGEPTREKAHQAQPRFPEEVAHPGAQKGARLLGGEALRAERLAEYFGKPIAFVLPS